MSVLNATSAWLRSHPLHVGNSVLIPLRPGKKQPLVSHKLPGQWDWSTFDVFVKENPLHSDWGILLDRIVICIRSNNLYTPFHDGLECISRLALLAVA
eukprot:gene26293-17384_t